MADQLTDLNVALNRVKEQHIHTTGKSIPNYYILRVITISITWTTQFLTVLHAVYIVKK